MTTNPKSKMHFVCLKNGVSKTNQSKRDKLCTNLETKNMQCEFLHLVSNSVTW